MYLSLLAPHFNPLFASMDVLLKRKDVSRYPWFGSRDVQGSEGEDIPVNSKYPLSSNEEM